MMKHELEELVPEMTITDEMFDSINDLYMRCDLFDSRHDMAKFLNAFGYDGAMKLLSQYDKRQLEIETLRSQRSALLAKVCKVSNDLINSSNVLSTMAKNFLKDITNRGE